MDGQDGRKSEGIVVGSASIRGVDADADLVGFEHWIACGRVCKDESDVEVRERKFAGGSREEPRKIGYLRR